VKIGDHEYRPVEASDFPKITLGVLKVFYLQGALVYPAKFLGNTFDCVNGTGWHIVGSESCGKDGLAYGNTNIYVDVTPRKKYVVWSNKAQRFVMQHGLIEYFDERLNAELSVESWSQLCDFDRKNYSVVEFNVPENNNG